MLVKCVKLWRTDIHIPVSTKKLKAEDRKQMLQHYLDIVTGARESGIKLENLKLYMEQWHEVVQTANDRHVFQVGFYE